MVAVWQSTIWKLVFIKTLVLLAVVLGLYLIISTAPVRAEHYIYTVRPGDNPWNLAQRYLKSMRYWQPLQRLNGIEQPLTIPPGTRLKFPIAWLKVQPANVTVLEVRGKVSVIRQAGTDEQSLNTGDRLKIGDRILVGETSSGTLEFADGSRMLLQAGTELVFDQLSAYGDTGMVDSRLRMPSGRVDTQVTPSKGPASRYEITTPSAVAAVRGTDFRVSANGAEGEMVTRTEVLTGLVGVAAVKVKRDVPAGFGTVTEAGKPPSPPRKLLPAPDTRTIPARFVHVPFPLEWTEVADAVAYRAQLFPLHRPEALLQDHLVNTTQVSDVELADGNYVLRLRAVDALGLEGLNTEHHFTVDNQPLAPTPQDLIDGKIIHDTQPVFNWTQPPEGAMFHFQLARDENFASLVLDLPQHQDNHFHANEELEPGAYYWRVASIRDSGKKGPFSASQQFEIASIPATPQFAVPIVDDDWLMFRWAPVTIADRYEIQLAHDPDFKDLLWSETTGHAELKSKRPLASTYYARVRALDSHGYPGPYSDTQEVDVAGDKHVPLILMIALLLLL